MKNRGMKNRRGHQGVRKKAVSYLLTAAMVVGGLTLSPIATRETKAATIMTTSLGTQVLGTNVNKYQYGIYAAEVYYGEYRINGNHWPITWRVIGYDGQADGVVSESGKATLIASISIQGGQRWKYSDNDSNNYLTSVVHNQIINEIFNGSDNGSDNFTSREKNAIIGRTLSPCTLEVVNGNHDVDHKTDTTEKDYCDGISDSSAIPNVSLWSLSTAEAMKINPNLRAQISDETWWLRSPGENSAAAAYAKGNVVSKGRNDGTILIVRPAFHLNLSEVLFTTEMYTGRPTFADGATTSPASNAKWILTLKDGNTGFTASRTDSNTITTTAGGTISLGSIGGVTTTSGVASTQISAMLAADNDTVLRYGKIANTTDITKDVTIPSGLPAGDYSLKVFSEAANTGTTTNYASNIVSIPFTVVAPKNYNTPASISRNGVTATVSYTPTSPQVEGTSVTATVKLSGTATAAGTYSISLSCNTVPLSPTSGEATKVKHVNGSDTPDDTYEYTFSIGTADISDIVLTHTFEADTHTITVTPTSHDFGTKQTGYTRPDAQTFTITNTGNTDIAGFTVSGSSDYEIVYSSGTISKNNGTADFTVQPMAGLPVGAHTATITVDTDPAQETPVQRQVSFTVTAPTPTPTPTPTPSPTPTPTPSPSPTPTPSPSPTPGPSPTPTVIPTSSGMDADQSSGTKGKKIEETDNLSWTYQETQADSLCIKEQQGPLCRYAFKAATPVGYTEAFTFNLQTKGKDNLLHITSDPKTGEFVLYIPKGFKKDGRTFCLIGIDKYGKTKLFTDEDLKGDTITVKELGKLEGYAFSLIYIDQIK